MALQTVVAQPEQIEQTVATYDLIIRILTAFQDVDDYIKREAFFNIMAEGMIGNNSVDANSTLEVMLQAMIVFISEYWDESVFAY